jgi:NAD(P)-dependent dehydrogenase (short-subunit alcohol dehydrogenase family)
MPLQGQRQNYAEQAERTAKQGQAIQQRIDWSDLEHNSDKSKPMQAGAREYPVIFGYQHQSKPGEEQQLEPAPMYDAPDYKGSEKLMNKVAIITGGDSGIGRAVAVLYAREGADVAIIYLNEHKDAEETKRAVEDEGRSCLLISGDVSDPQFCKDAVTQVINEFGQLNILVDNSAFQQHVQNFEELSDEQFDRTMKTNLYGYFYMAKAVVPHLKQGDSIVMTGSVTALAGNKHLLDYSLTKGGIHTFARSLSESLMDKGIRVNVVAPGPVWTPLNPADAPPDKVAKFGTFSAMQRAAQPEEIAPAYVFLAAPCCSSYITGEVLPIIGGYKGG